MTTYNNNNIKKLLSLLDTNNKRGGVKKRTCENLIWRLGKLGINKKEVIDAIQLLLDLNVLQETEATTGDGWNTRGSSKYYSIIETN